MLPNCIKPNCPNEGFQTNISNCQKGALTESFNFCAKKATLIFYFTIFICRKSHTYESLQSLFTNHCKLLVHWGKTWGIGLNGKIPHFKLLYLLCLGKWDYIRFIYFPNQIYDSLVLKNMGMNFLSMERAMGAKLC